jgi:MarR family transcriptional regulator, organic hydroperoxide resistance regulator
MNKADVLKLDNQLCFAMYTCSREITKVYKPYLDELGLTYTQYITMLVVWETPVITVKDLGIRLHLDSGTLTPLLKKLEGLGLVERKRDSSDERSVIISLTHNGSELKKRAEKIPSKVFCGSGLSIEEAVLLREQLKKIIKHINS